jgi:hypothetical protein
LTIYADRNLDGRDVQGMAMLLQTGIIAQQEEQARSPLLASGRTNLRI